MFPSHLSPFSGLSPHFLHPSGRLAAWLTEPLGMISVIAPDTHYDASMARFVAEEVYEHVLRARRSPEQKFVFVHDYSRLKSYDTEARKILIDWGLAIGTSNVQQVVMIIKPETSALVRMGANIGATALRVMGIKMEVRTDTLQVLSSLSLRPRRITAGVDLTALTSPISAA